MINDEAAPHVIDIAKNFISLLMRVEPEWQTGYFRFHRSDLSAGVKASYATASDVQLVDVLGHKGFFHPALEKGKELLSALGKTTGVFLLVVKSNLDYEIFFDYDDPNQCQFDKLDGNTGIPKGL